MNWRTVIVHADSFRGNVGPKEKSVGEVIVQGNDALLSVNNEMVVARVEAQLAQVMTVRK